MWSTIAVLSMLIHPVPNESANTECRCESNRRTDGWCSRCRVGYLAGVRIESARFFEALDAHGHEIDPKTLKCETCRTAYEKDGYCTSCTHGFVSKQLYFSRLTYFLARGVPKEKEAVTCPECRKHTESAGWCTRCSIGMVAHRAYIDRTEFDRASRLRELLIQAVREADRCLTCALAIINDRSCARCKVSFADGVKSPDEPPQRPQANEGR